MHGLFCEIQISEEAHERRQNAARFRSVKSLNGPAELFGHKRRHLRQTSKRSGSTQLRSGFPYAMLRLLDMKIDYRDGLADFQFDPNVFH
jgi:hypothetical protein